MIQKILFPVDFLSPSVAMAAYVKRAASIFGAEVTIVHVCDLSSHNGFELYARPATDIAREHWNLAQHNLEQFLASEFPTMEPPGVLLGGDAASAIVETARKNKFDLIMMPTHAGRFRRLLLGSTTAKVLNRSDCPVLTTEHAEAVLPRPLEHRNWVCAIGLSSDSERVLHYANDATLATRSNLSLIHVVEPGKAHSEAHGSFDELRKARERIAELQRRVGSEASVSIAVGPVTEKVLDQVRQACADVLVIGRRRQGISERLENLTYSLVRDSPCPVVTV